MAYVQGESLKAMLPSSTVFNSRLLRRPQGLCALKSTLEINMENPGVFVSAKAAMLAFEETRAILQAFGTMLDLSLENGSADLEPVSFGIRRLLDAQMSRLEDIESTLKYEMQRLKADKLTIKDPSLISRITGIAERDVKSVIWATYDIDAAPFEDEALADRKFLYKVFKQKMHDAWLIENVAGTISKWSGVPKEHVDKVIEAIDDGVADYWDRTHVSARAPEVVFARQEVQEATERYGAALEAAKDTVSEAENDSSAQQASDFKQELLQRIGSEDIHRVAQKLNLDDDTVYSVIVSIAAPTDDAPELRTDTIANKLKGGVDTAEIAQALNMKKATVDRVIARLMAAPPQDTADQQAANG